MITLQLAVISWAAQFDSMSARIKIPLPTDARRYLMSETLKLLDDRSAEFQSWLEPAPAV
jgi:hypothetical protein